MSTTSSIDRFLRQEQQQPSAEPVKSTYSRYNPFFYAAETFASGAVTGAVEKIEELFEQKSAELTQQLEGISCRLPEEVYALKTLLSRTVSQRTSVADFMEIAQIINSIDSEDWTKMSTGIRGENGKLLHVDDASLHRLLSLPDRLCSELKNLETEGIVDLKDLSEDLREAVHNSYDLLSFLIQKKEGLVSKIERQLTDPDQGIVSKTIDVMMQKFDQQMNRVPHHTLIQAHAEAIGFKRLMKRTASPEQFLSSATALAEALVALLKKEQKAFQYSPLSPTDRLFLLDFLKFLRDVLEQKVSPADVHQNTAIAIKQLVHTLSVYRSCHEGFAARSARIFKEQFVEQSKKIPSAILSQIPTAPIPALDFEMAAESVLSFKEYLQSAVGILEGFAHWTGGAIAQKALEKFCLCFLMGLSNAKQYAQKKPEYHLAVSALEGLITDVEKMLLPENPQQFSPSNVLQLAKLVKRSFLALNQHQIFLNGWKIPRLGGAQELNRDSIAQFADNIKKLNDKPANIDLCDYKARIEIEKKAFIQNTSRYAALKLVYESPVLCGIIPKNEDFYYQLMEEAQRANPENPLQELKKQFFEKIDAAYANGQISVLSKWFSKSAYVVIRPILNYFIDLYAARFINLLQDNVENNFKTLANESIGHLTNYLPILNNAFRRVSYQQEDVGCIDAMIQEQLHKADAHEKKELDVIYAEFTRVCIDQFAPRFEWAAAAGEWLNKKKFISPSALQKCANFCLEAVAAVIRWTLYLPQLMINQILISLAKRVMVRNQFVRTMVENIAKPKTALGGYNHALNCALYEQLQKISEVIRTALEEKKASKKPRYEPPSFAKRGMFRELTANLLELLPLSHCSTQKELRKLFESTSLAEIIDKHTLDQIVDISLQLQSLAIDAICEKDQINKLILEFMSRMNKIYSIGADVSLEEVKAKQAQLNAIHDKLIRQVIDYSLMDYFDTSLDSLKNRAHEFMDSLKTSSQEFSTKTQEHLNDFNIMATRNTENSLQLLQAMKQCSEQFQNARSNAQFDATGENFDSETLKRFDDHSFTLGKSIGMLDEQLLTMLSLQTDTQAHQKIQSNLQAFQKLWIQALLKLRSPETKLSERAEFSEIFEGIEQLLETMPANAALPEGWTIPLQESILTLRSQESRWFASRKALHAAAIPLNPDLNDSIIGRLYKEKEAEFLAPFEAHQVQKLYQKAQQQVLHLTNAENRQRLTEKIQQLAECRTPQAFGGLQQEFKLLYEEALRYENHLIEASLDTLQMTFNYNEALTAEQINESERKIHENFFLLDKASLQYQSQLAEVRAWANSLKDIPILNFQISDMNWMEDYAKGIAFPIVKDKLEKLTEFINKGYNRENIILHTMILPMIRS